MLALTAAPGVAEVHFGAVDEILSRAGQVERISEVQLKEGLGNWASVYPLREKGRLPGKYASRLTIYAYKDGRPLTRKLEKGQMEYLVAIFWLIRGKPGDLTFVEEPLAEFDTLMNQILARVSEFTKI